MSDARTTTDHDQIRRRLVANAVRREEG